MRISSLLVLFSLILISVQCKRDRRAQPMPESIGAYIDGFTSGIISKASPIRVRFASIVASPEEVGAEVKNKIIDFTPSIAGKAVWEDEQSIRFDPDQPLTSGTAYVARVNLKKLFSNIPAEAEQFEFDFHTRNQYYDITVLGLYPPDVNNLAKQELRGQITTADVATPEEVEPILTATQKGKSLEISWIHSGDQLTHDFVVSNVARTEEATKVTLKWTGKSLGVDLKGEKEIEVPSLSDFKVTDAQAFQNPEQYIHLHFSDPILASQDLNGLVSLSDYDGDLRFTIDGPEVRIYPARRLTGDVLVTVSTGIMNSQKRKMKNPGNWSVHFEDVRPEVRLVGRGVIMPNSEGLVFPFDAIGLTAVEVEIFKIYNNNILQFLQTNDLDGEYDLRRVGRVILQKKVDLTSINPNSRSADWTRYSLDLGKLFEQDPEAIYQVRIGFRPAYAAFPCSDKAQGSNGDDGDEGWYGEDYEEPGDEGEIKSIMEGWYGIEGYYQGYNWEQRENPCFPAYYNYERFISRNIIASNLGILAKGGSDNSWFVSISDLRTTQPLSSVECEFFDFQQQSLRKVVTDGQGMAMVQLDRRPFVVVAKKGSEKGYLRLNDGQSLSMSRFDVSGEVNQKGIKGYIYGERGVWRPGDSVFLHFVLEDNSGKLPPNYPVQFEVTDARGQNFIKRSVIGNTGVIYPLHFATSPNAPTGNWTAMVKAGGATFQKTLKIETVKPNRLKIDLDFGGDMIRAGDGLVAGLTSTWLHGAPAGGLEAKVEAQLRPSVTTFSLFKDFVFDDPARKFTDEAQTVFDGQLDASGKATFNIDLADNRRLPGKLNASFKTRVFEKGGDFSTDNITLPYSPFTAYAGVDIPTNQYGENRLEIDKNGTLSFASVDESGRALSGRKLSVGLYRVNWRWWWDYGYDDVSRYNTSNNYDAVQKSDLVTNSKGEAQWSVKVPEWGRYLVRVCDQESGHCSGDFFYAGYPWYGDEDNDQFRQAASMLAFSSDKSKYNVGETVKLTIPTGQKGRALVTIENGARVMESHWTEAKEGENTFTFKTTPEMAPNVYVHVDFVQPHAQALNDLPIRLYGVIPVYVEDPNTHLAPKIKMPDVVKPEQKVEIEVSEDKGREMAYTIDIVDEGLLGLTRFKTPNPWENFFAKEALGVQSWDLYDQVLGAHAGDLGRILSIGGDGEVQPGEDEQANRFKPVVLHLGPFTLKKGKKAKHTIDMPNYVGAVRAMVVAANKGAYGSAEKSVPVRQPLMVLATLPRVLGPGEMLRLPVNVFAMEDKVKSATVTVKETNGLARVVGSASQQVSFSRPGDKLATFDVQISDKVGIAKFVIQAEGSGEKSSQEVEIQVRNPNPYVTNVAAKVLDGNQSWDESFTAVGMPGSNEAVLEVSSIPPINLGQRLRYLLQYPYGCLEQTLSGGFPQLYVNKLMELNEEQKKRVPENITATIERLKLFQTDQGGFAYWPGNSAPDHWATNYAGHFLLEAKALGYTVPASLLDRWEQFQKKTARMWDPKMKDYGFYSDQAHELSQAYRLYTLALSGEPELGAMNRLRETKNLCLQAKWMLAAAYAQAGKKDVGQTIVKNLSRDIQDYTELSYTFGSALRDRALVTETLLLLGDRTAAGEMVKYLSDALSSQRWLSTQETSFCLLAIGKFVGDSNVDAKVKFAYQVNGGQTINAGSNTPVFSVKIPVNDAGSTRFKVTNPGGGTLFARLIQTGQPLAGQEDARSSNLEIKVSYADLEGHAIDPSSMAQGMDFIATVTVQHPGIRPIRYDELALNQIFPSGWEILNTRMDNVQNFTNTSIPEYQDFRDDRVYTFFDLPQNKTQVYRVQLNAAYQGRFYLPAVSCEAMYDNSINARTAGRWVEVSKSAGEI